MSASADSHPAPRRVLLTGPPGCGKTTIIRRTVKQLSRQCCAGFLTEEVRDRGLRVGFDIVTMDGRRAPLARRGAPGPRVGRYGVDVEVFERIAVAPLETLHEDIPRRLLILDEIGKMELLSRRFVALLETLLAPASGCPMLGAIMRGRHPVADRLRRQADIRIITVTPANREALPARLAGIFMI